VHGALTYTLGIPHGPWLRSLVLVRSAIRPAGHAYPAGWLMVLAAVGRVADQNAGVHVGRLNATATAGAGVGAPVTALTPLRPAGGTDGDYGDWDAATRSEDWF
jgi:hypothetical protein